MNDGCLIGGTWTPATAGTLPAEDPSDGGEIGRIARGGAAEIDAAVAAARAALAGDWGGASAAERGVDLGAAAARDPADLAAVGRILRGQRSRGRRRPGASDQAAAVHPAISSIGTAARSSRV